MKRSLKLLAVGALFGAGSLFAQSTASTSTTNLSGEKILKAITPDSISHFSIVNGPAINGESQRFDENGELGDGGLDSWHQVSLRYQLTKNTRLVINPRFTIDYNNPDFAEDETMGVKAQLDNPVIGIATTWYKNGKFSWSGGLNTVLWVVDEGDQDDGLIANPGGFQVLNYQASRDVSVGSYLWARYRVFTNNDERAKLPVYIAPYVGYQLNDKISFQTFYDFNADEVELSEVTWAPKQEQVLNLLMSVSVAKNLTIQPILQLYRGSKFALDKSNLQFWVSGRFF